MSWRTRTSALVAATALLASCGGGDHPKTPAGPPQQKAEGRAARAITARYDCTRVVVRGLPALARLLEDRGYCATSRPVLTVVVATGTRDGSAVDYGSESAATLIQTALVKTGARNLGVSRRGGLGERTVTIHLRGVRGAAPAIAAGIVRFEAP